MHLQSQPGSTAQLWLRRSINLSRVCCGLSLEAKVNPDNSGPRDLRPLPASRMSLWVFGSLPRCGAIPRQVAQAPVCDRGDGVPSHQATCQANDLGAPRAHIAYPQGTALVLAGYLSF